MTGRGGTVLLCARPPHLWIADQVRNDGGDGGVVLFHPLLPCQALGQALVLCRQGRGESGWFGLFTLTFDSSPIKGEGE